MTTQTLRSSQIITTYGPGAIIEAPGGPGVILSIEKSGIFSSSFGTVRDYEIRDERLTKVLDGAKLFRIPTNDELRLSSNHGFYSATPFPTWSLCVKHKIIYKYHAETGGCPDCSLHSNEQRKTARLQTIRFLQICSNGHMDDLPWTSLMHNVGDRCRPKHLLWKGSGSNESNKEIECPKCGASRSMGDLYKTGVRCTGLLPEQSGTERVTCNSRARIVKRHAAMIRVAITKSSVTIPRIDSNLYGYLSNDSVKTAIISGAINTKEELIIPLGNLVDYQIIDRNILDRVNDADEQEVKDVISRIKEADQDLNSEMAFRLVELGALETASEEGHPAITQNSEDPEFEVQKNLVRSIETDSGRKMRITPVTRLTVTTVQTGYRRIWNEEDGQSVDIGYLDPRDSFRTKWYPAVKSSGEGVFIEWEDPNSNNVSGPHCDKWLEKRNSANTHSPSLISLTSWGDEALRPETVWWHTLSHRIISSLSIDSGYSATALKERVYVNTDSSTGKIRGGLLIYTAQPGGDGTLGGLVESATFFEKILRSALQDLEFCSNDPLCGMREINDDTSSGSACYACLFLAETSCELMNTCLDRNVLLENLP